MLCSEVLEIFLKQKTVEGVTDDTLKHYNTQINLFINFVNNCDIKNINYNVYQDYIINLKNRFNIGSGINKNKKLASRTIKTYASAIRTFFQFCYDFKYIDIDIAQNIKMPKYQKKVITVLNNEQLKKILISFNINTFSGSRDLLIFCLMLDCGLRLSEVCNLKYNDFDFYNKIIKINGKGQKQRYVPLSSTLEKVFIYYDTFCINNLSDNYKYYSFFRTIDDKNINKNTISLIFKRLSKKLNFSIHPHLIRHTFATHFLQNGGDIENLRIILGHSTFYMTEQYLHFVNSLNMKKQVKYSPLNIIKKEL